MLRLGTRGSLLAIAQSRNVARQIEAHLGIPVEIRIIRTRGDEIQDRALSEIGGKGLFTRELDEALLREEIDLAVHSLKDLPTEFPDGLALGAVPEREDSRDVLLGPASRVVSLETLPKGSAVGTGSLRRSAFLRLHRPDLRILPIRGNLDTRIRKLDRGDYDAIVLAAAGLRRLGWGDRIHEALDEGAWLPAPAQGALGIVVRAADSGGTSWLRTLDHEPTRCAVTAERALLHELGAGCQLPVGALALPFSDRVRLRAMVLDPDGGRLVRAQATGSRKDPAELGRRVAGTLLGRGADLLLGDLKAALVREG